MEGDLMVYALLIVIAIMVGYGLMATNDNFTEVKAQLDRLVENTTATNNEVNYLGSEIENETSRAKKAESQSNAVKHRRTSL